MVDRPDRDGRRRPPAWLVVACVYAPYSWLLVVDLPWNSYQIYWMKLWPVLPGLLVSVLIPGLHQQPEEFEFSVMGAVSALVFAGACAAARRGGRVAALVLGVVAALSVGNAWVAYQLFLS